MRRWLAVALVLVAGCSKDKDKPKDTREALGEPIGAQVPAAGKVPSLSIAFAVSKGSDPVPLLTPFVDGVVKSAAACPDFTGDMFMKPLEPQGFELTIEGGKVQVAGRPDPSASTQCFVRNLNGREVGPATTPKLTGRVEILINATDAGQP